MSFDKKYLIAIFPLLVMLIFFFIFPDIVTYVILAWVVSMIGAPLMRFFNRFKFIGRNAAAVMTLFSFVLLLGLIVYIIIPPLLQQARNLADADYDKIVSNFEEPLSEWNTWLIKRGLLEEPTEKESLIAVEKDTGNSITTKVIRIDSLLRKDTLSTIPEIAIVVQIDNSYLDNKPIENTEEEDASFFGKVKQNIYNFLDPSKIPELFGSVIGFFSNLFIAVMSVFFVAFFFLREQGLFGNIISAIVPNKYEGQGIHALEDSSKLLIRYFLGLTVQIIVITLFVTLALTLFGLKNALLIGFFAALMNIIPYLGPILGASFGIIITISSFTMDPVTSVEFGAAGQAGVSHFYDNLLPSILKLLAVFGLMQVFDNFIFQPFIFGKSVKAHPLEIFVVVLMGAKLGGVLGMVLAIPVYTILRVVAKVFMSEFKIVQQITKNI